MKAKIFIVIIFILGFIGLNSIFIVDETMQAIVTQFGKPVGSPITEPGIQFRIPIIHKVNYFNKNLLVWDGDPDEIPTNDKKYIWVDTFARWRITDPLLFFQTVNNMTQARGRLNEIINAAVRDFIAKYPLIELVRQTNRKLMSDQNTGEKIADKTLATEITIGRERIVAGILKQATLELNKFGIEVVDVAIKRLNYTEKVRNTVYNRMIAEREQIAQKFRSEGEGEARKIEGKGVKELKRIESEAYRVAEEIKGKADAEASLIYAKAYSKDADFYTFLKSLDVYKKTLENHTSLVLSTDSEFLKYLTKYSKD